VKTIVAIGLMLPVLASAQIEIVPDEQMPAVFAGRPQTIRMLFRNSSNETVETKVETRLRQLSAGTAMTVSNTQSWKRIRLLPQQTVVETYITTFSPVRAATKFEIEWIGIDRTPIMVYPPDLLKKLSYLAGEKPLAIFDPDNRLRSLTKQAGIEFTDYEMESADARLAIAWSNAKELPEFITKRVKNGMAAVWIRSSASAAAYAVRLDTGIVVMASASSVSPLADSPRAQLDLIKFCEFALEPESMRLPSDKQTQ
jgi:hypothetical protein